MTTVDDTALLRTMFYLWERLKVSGRTDRGAGCGRPCVEAGSDLRGKRVGVKSQRRQCRPHQVAGMASRFAIARVGGVRWHIGVCRDWSGSGSSRTPRRPAEAGTLHRREAGTPRRPRRSRKSQGLRHASTAPLTILKSRVYSTVPVDGAGGLAACRDMKKQLTAAGRRRFSCSRGLISCRRRSPQLLRRAECVAALMRRTRSRHRRQPRSSISAYDVSVERMREASGSGSSAVIDTRTGKPIGGASRFVIKTFAR